MLKIDYICDKCKKKTTEEYDTIPGKRDWVQEVRKTLTTVYIDNETFSVCEECFTIWDEHKKQKDKEKKDEFFPKKK